MFVLAFGGLPGESRPILVDAARWSAALPPGTWPEGFGASGQVWRREVFAVAQRWRDGDVPSVQLAAASLAWGYGRRGYGPYRTSAILSREDAAPRLNAALEGLRGDTPSLETLVGSYRLFMTTSKLTGLGPAFFSKILHFAGYRRGRGGTQPLILDSVVAARLPDEAGAARRYRSGWWSSTWRDYLLWAALQADRSGYAGEPDQVEMALFAGRWAP